MPKTKKSDKFLKLVDQHRESKKAQKFEGTLAEYLEILDKQPGVAKLAHKRLYDAIAEHGVTRMTKSEERCSKIFGGEELRTYDYFQSMFFGMERSLAKIMRFLRSASMKGEESRQVLLLLGPVGAGKSALMERIKGVLEMCEPMFHIKDCPIHEEPLHLVPRSLREQFKEIYGVTIEGDLCPVCRHRLKEEYGNPPVIITENGTGVPGGDTLMDGTVQDAQRTDYLVSHVAAVGEAIRQGVDVQGYFHWSSHDNFEWISGTGRRFGLIYVDFSTQTRTLKQSAGVYRDIITGAACRHPAG